MDGAIDVVQYATAFGAVGMMIDSPDQIGSVLRRAFEIPGLSSSVSGSIVETTTSCSSEPMIACLFSSHPD